MTGTEKTLQKQQFFNIFTIEMWERFAFYSFNGLFVLFAISTYFNEKSAYLVFGIFMALAYGLPTIGGIIADRLIGIKRTLIAGAIVLPLGYLILALSFNYESTLTALAFIAVGNALFKPNPSSMIGIIYKTNPAQTNSAFTMYYMAINIGSLIASVLSPLIAKYTSFKVAFIIACIGMLFSLLNFVLKYKIFRDIHNKVGSKKLKSTNLFFALLITAFIIVFSYVMLNFSDIAFYIILVLTIACYSYLIVNARTYDNKSHMIKQLIGVFIFIQALLFFIIYTQMFSTLIVFAKNNIDLNLLGFEVSPASFTALNPFWILVLSPILSKIYISLHQRNIHSSTGGKYAIAMFCCAAAFFALIIACLTVGDSAKINGLWMVLYYFLTSLAELLISAIGLAVAAQYFPKNKLSFCMGAWLLAQGCGNALAGKIAGFIAMPKDGIPTQQSLHIFSNYFYIFAISCLAIAILFTITAIIFRKIADKHNIKLA